MPGPTRHCALALLALSGSPSPPQASRLPDPVGFQLTHLALDLAVDYERGTVAGSATLRVRNLSGAPAVRIPLLLNRLMSVTEVRNEGRLIPVRQQVSLFVDDSSRQVNAIVVELDHPVAPGDSATVAIRYGGVLVGYTETGSLYIRDRVDRAFTIIREDAYAFPVPGVLSSTRNRAAPRARFGFTARVTVPAPLVVAMGGAAEETLRGDSLLTWRSHSIEPVPFLNITIAPYRISGRADTRIFSFPEDSAGAQMVEEAIAGATERLERWYGALDRSAGLTVMEIPDGFGSQADLAAGILQSAAAFKDRRELGQLYHELSHLWNPADLERPSPRWNEGLASFLEYRMAAELDGWTKWPAVLSWATTSLMTRCRAPARCDSIPPSQFGREGMTDYSYTVGMLLFYSLYQVLGAEAFDRGYRGYYQQYRGSGGTTAQLMAAFHGVDPRSDRVFEDWMNSTAWYRRLAAGESVEQMVAGYRGG